MDIERHVERLGALEDRPEAPVVEEYPVGRSVHHRTLEAQLGDRALELVRRRFRVGGGKRGEAGEAVRVRTHRLVQAVVRALCERDRGRCVETLRRRGTVRDHLNVDPGFVHLPDAQRAQVVQPPAQLRAARLAAPEGSRHVRVPIMLFERDDEGSVFGCHRFDRSRNRSWTHRPAGRNSRMKFHSGMSPTLVTLWMIGSRKFTTLGGSCGASLPSMICRSNGPWLMRISTRWPWLWRSRVSPGASRSS